MLNRLQTLAADACLALRPEVVQGTRVIVNNVQRGAFYEHVRNEMKRTKVNERDVCAFCDRAGVPD
jgi:hypothetical protein